MILRMLHLADLHLGWEPAFLGAKAAERRRERDGLLRRTVDVVLEERPVDLVIIAGDLFETHTPPDGLVETVLQDLQRLVDAGVQLVTVPGNHDELTYADSVYRRFVDRWPGVLIQNPMPGHVTTLDVAGATVHIYGLAYVGGLTRAVPPIAEFPRLEAEGYHIAVFHGSLDWDAGERSLPLSSDALKRANYDYVALGHIHRHQVHHLGRGKAVYPGAVEGKTFRDPGTGELVFVRLDGKEIVVDTYPLPTRTIKEVEVDVTDCEDSEDVFVTMRQEADENAIVRLRAVGAAPGPLSPEKLQERLTPHFYYVEVVDETTMLNEAVIALLADEPTVRGQFVRRMRQALREAKDDEQKKLLNAALRRGLAALEGRAS